MTFRSHVSCLKALAAKNAELRLDGRQLKVEREDKNRAKSGEKSGAKSGAKSR